MMRATAVSLAGKRGMLTGQGKEALSLRQTAPPGRRTAVKKINHRKVGTLGTLLLAALLTLSACAVPADEPARTAAQTASASVTAEPAAQSTGVYRSVTAEEAKQKIDGDPSVIVLDVREQTEYDAGHIPNATLLPLGQIEQRAAEVLPDKDASILVYCRSGRRSKAGAETLIGLGYTNVLDMGGISSWPYDVVTD